MNDYTEDQLRLFHPSIREKAIRFITALRLAGIPAYIGNAGGIRTHEEQARLVSAGRSETLRSKHIEGKAFDIDILGFGRDQLPKSFWNDVGRFGEKLGLRWGGRFKGFYDAGHFEV